MRWVREICYACFMVVLVPVVLAATACSTTSTVEVVPPTFEVVVQATQDVIDPVTGEVLDLSAAITQGCAGVDASNFDVTITWWLGENGEAGTTIRKFEVSGNDYRMTDFYLDPLDSSLVGRGEQIRKDGVSYVRVTIDGDPETWGEWQKYNGYFETGPGPCPHIDPEYTDMVRVGPRHFVLKEGAVEGVEAEFWLDENGAILQELEWVVDIGRFGKTYSDIGVPNLITVPGETPAPTPLSVSVDDRIGDHPDIIAGGVLPGDVLLSVYCKKRLGRLITTESYRYCLEEWGSDRHPEDFDELPEDLDELRSVIEEWFPSPAGEPLIAEGVLSGDLYSLHDLLLSVYCTKTRPESHRACMERWGLDRSAGEDLDELLENPNELRSVAEEWFPGSEEWFLEFADLVLQIVWLEKPRPDP